MSNEGGNCSGEEGEEKVGATQNKGELEMVAEIQVELEAGFQSLMTSFQETKEHVMGSIEGICDSLQASVHHLTTQLAEDFEKRTNHLEQLEKTKEEFRLGVHQAMGMLLSGYRAMAAVKIPDPVVDGED